MADRMHTLKRDEDGQEKVRFVANLAYRISLLKNLSFWVIWLLSGEIAACYEYVASMLPCSI